MGRFSSLENCVIAWNETNQKFEKTREVFDMPSVTQHVLPKLHSLPTTLPLEGAVRIELEEGVPIFRASETVQTRIDTLLEKQFRSSQYSRPYMMMGMYFFVFSVWTSVSSSNSSSRVPNPPGKTTRALAR